MKIEDKKTKRIASLVIVIIWILSIAINFVMASEEDVNRLDPDENIYLELRAVSVKAVDGQNKQVMMELWGNNVNFKRI